MVQRILIHLYGAAQQPGFVIAIRLLRHPDGRHCAAKKFRLLLVTARFADIGQFGVGSHAPSRALLPIGRIHRNRLAGRRFGFFQPSRLAEPVRLPDQWAFFKLVLRKKRIEVCHNICVAQLEQDFISRVKTSIVLEQSIHYLSRLISAAGVCQSCRREIADRTVAAPMMGLKHRSRTAF